MSTPAPVAVAVVPGVYLDAQRYSALVFSVRDGWVYYVANEDGKMFDVHAKGVESFKQRYIFHLPNYPVRRCARIFHGGTFPKAEQAMRVLAHLLKG